MLLMLVSLLCCVTAAKACLQCDRSIRMMHEDFILSASTVQDQIDLKKICDQAYVTYIETSQERKGVIGLLQRRVMDCLSCRYKVYVCPSPTDQQDCGEYPVLAEEGGQAVLNCFLPWHTLLLGTPEYHYSWVPGPSGTEKMDESDFKVLVVTDDSHVVLNQLRLDEEGTYRCSLQDQIGTIFYQAIFPLTVIPLPRQTPRPLVSLPSLSHGDSYSLFQPTEDLLVPLIAVVTALSLTASVGLTVVLRMMMTRQRAATELRSKKGNGTENTA
ncbi:izumo sperm-egg fusion protein 1 isoform X2 [Archocentrus centrarchus]|uniref:izumo sperm-egg fusion protein 1 isoform X2 n=1 Tax=Archocentrus centrarchus TaxID=63155 RepID=UPI0011E9F0B8|nr:izumo sperm-egg fusion protein 1 isoform X2 [Archocentrus centrarchus]